MTQTGHAGVVDSYELSPTQEGMLFHSLLREATGVDLEQIVCTVRGPFDEHAFVAAFHEVATRHAILRTRFSHDGVGRPVQVQQHPGGCPLALPFPEVDGRQGHGQAVAGRRPLRVLQARSWRGVS